jgi:hypothetical protein
VARPVVAGIAPRPLHHLALAACALALAGPAGARDLPTGVPELALRFDNTFRYNVGLRTDPIHERIGANPVFTAGEYSVRRGGLTTSRLDLISELDLAWRDHYGVRVSGVGWYDYAYQDGGVTRSPAYSGAPGTYVGDDLSRYTLRRYRGPWGELLDAFAFASVELAGVPTTVKAGRHALSWGESLMLGGAIHGVAYAQVPLDLQKGFATPGIEAKEMFRPLTSVSAQVQATPALSVAAQVFLEWQSFVYPEGATFLGGADFTFNGPDGVYRVMNGNPAYLKNGGVSHPRDAGDLGLALRWSPGWLDGTLGLYYRRYTDKLGAVLLTDNPGGEGPMSPAVPSPFQYRQYYGEDVDLFGLSLAKQVAGVSLGAEIAYRRDGPLLAQSLGFAVPPSPSFPQQVIFPSGRPRLVGNTYQARGDTLHAVLNTIGVLSGGRLFGSASWAAEVTYSRWLEVRHNRDMFFAEGFGVCRDDPALASSGFARARRDGCATRDHVALSAGFTPTWFRVLPGLDLLLPLSASWTISGNSPVMLGGNEASGTFGAGVAADFRNAWRVELRYADYFGRTEDDGTRVTSANGLLALLQNRGSVTLTAKATF